MTRYHLYKNQWLPEYGQLLNVESEPSNRHDGYAVAVKKENNVVGHLLKDSRHVIFFFLQADSLEKCIAIVTGQPVNLGDKFGQICKELPTHLHKWPNVLNGFIFQILEIIIRTLFKTD